MHAVGRIAYRGAIDNIQVSWGQDRRRGGRADPAGRGQRPGRHLDGREHLGAAGASHGQLMEEAGFMAIDKPLGRPLEQRSRLYGPVPAPA